MKIIDAKILDKKTVHLKRSVYKNVVNYLDEHGDLISLVNKFISPGPKRIWLNEDTDFLKHGSPDALDNAWIRALQRETDVIVSDFKMNTLFHTGTLNRSVIDPLQQMTCTYFVDERSDTIQCLIYEMIMERLKDYAQNKNVKSLLPLLGFGPGLTPLGDDVLLGFLLCKNQLDYDHLFNQKIKEMARVQTLPISSEFLQSACDCEYAEDFAQLIKECFIDQRFKAETVNRILQYGSSSGYGILLGFAECFKMYGGLNE